ncbi:MAG: hypothetical protein LBV16_02295 [Elusimicrobiota bacterium]|jgi:IS30 family transposase|nr:hypothetical protein [Elusimicrobiota bacterium]
MIEAQAEHWEMDLIAGAGGSILKVQVERKTTMTKIRKIDDKSAKE